MDLEKYAGWASIAAVLSVLHVCRVKVFFPSAGFFQCQFDNEQSGSRIGLFVGPPTEPPEWKAAMEKAWWYKASCLVLIPPGLITMACPDLFTPYLSWFPWRWGYGFALTISGALSYLNDVATWGEDSIYKTLDIIAAIWMMCLGLCLAFCEALGWAKWPLGCMQFFVSSMVIGLSCKILSAHYMGNKRSVQGYLFYHSLWHYVVSIAGGMCQLQMYLLQNQAEVPTRPIPTSAQ